jgi:hypothetical protein
MREKTEANFTKLANELAQKNDLSLTAFGLLVKMLLNKDDWKFSYLDLSKRSASGDRQTRSAVEELKEKGYLKIIPHKDQRGKITSWEWLVYENPNADVQSPDVHSVHVGEGVFNNKTEEVQDNSNKTIVTRLEVQEVIKGDESFFLGDESQKKIGEPIISDESEKEVATSEVEGLVIVPVDTKKKKVKKEKVARKESSPQSECGKRKQPRLLQEQFPTVADFVEAWDYSFQNWADPEFYQTLCPRKIYRSLDAYKVKANGQIVKYHDWLQTARTWVSNENNISKYQKDTANESVKNFNNQPEDLTTPLAKLAGYRTYRDAQGRLINVPTGDGIFNRGDKGYNTAGRATDSPLPI